MRGDRGAARGFIMFRSLEDRVPPDHPLRPIRRMVDRALAEMSPLFDFLYAAKVASPSRRSTSCGLRSLQILYAIPSERKLCEHLEYNLLFRWFVGLPFSEQVWHPTSFTKNRDRLLTPEVAGVFFEKIRSQAEAQKLLSREHFSVDGTLARSGRLLEELPPQRARRRTKTAGTTPAGGGGRNPEVDFHGERRRNDTHGSTTDPDARLARKGAGKEAKLAYAGHILVENRHGLIVACALTQATGKAEEEAALQLLFRERKRQRGRMTVGADRGYNTKELRPGGPRPWHHPPRGREEEVQRHRPTDHQLGGVRGQHAPAQDRGGALRLDEDRGGLRKLRHRGEEKVRAVFTFTCACFNLVRLGTWGRSWPAHEQERGNQAPRGHESGAWTDSRPRSALFFVSIIDRLPFVGVVFSSLLGQPENLRSSQRFNLQFVGMLAVQRFVEAPLFLGPAHSHRGD